MFIGHFGIGFGAKLLFYLRATEACDAVGRWALWVLVGFLIAIYFSNLFGSPPPSVNAIAWLGQAQWLVVAWGYWIDRHRPSVARKISGEDCHAQST